MRVEQISVFIENTPGRLAEITGLLGEHGIDFISLSIADTTSFGILRGIVEDPTKALDLVSKAGYTARINDVLVLSIPDEAGSLAHVLKALNDEGLNIEYLYSFLRTRGENALIIMRPAEIERAESVLQGNGIRMLTQEEVRAL